MNTNTYDWKTKDAAGRKKGSIVKNHISADQPFEYEEVVAIAGSEYVRSLHSDGVTFIPYEELRKYYTVFDLSEKDGFQMTPGIFDLHGVYV
ncbi:MAG: hypothetical protein JRF17_05280 [Deltaproteobacteria bacterium]|nr:hypothetical protein [Deltaproteobacteria bacterium]